MFPTIILYHELDRDVWVPFFENGEPCGYWSMVRGTPLRVVPRERASDSATAPAWIGMRYSGGVWLCCRDRNVIVGGECPRDAIEAAVRFLTPDGK